MAQTGFTPIQIYYSTTSSNLPLAANLTNGELAINSADGKLFYKDSGGTVQTLASQNLFASQTANYVYASPNGSAGVPTFRALVAADIPALSGSYVPYTGAASAVDLNAKTLVNVANLGVNTTTVPNIRFRVIGDNGSFSRLTMRGYSSDANSSAIRVSKFRGTAAAPQTPISGDSLGKFELAGYGSTAAEAYPQVSVEGVTTEIWSATARGAKALIKVTPNTTITQVTAVTVDQDSKATFAGALSVTGHTTFEGVTSTGATGTGKLVYDTSPTLVTPALGTPSALVGTNITGTATAFTASNVTTNANLTGPITSVGNATSIASQTGTGTKFVMDTSPTLVTPILGTPTSGNLANCLGVAKAALPAGTVIQVVQATYSTSVTVVNSAVYSDSGLTATITPISASNKILVIVAQSLEIGRDAIYVAALGNIVRTSTQVYEARVLKLAAALAGGAEGIVGANISMVYLDSPATTSATTYKTQFKSDTTANATLWRAQPNSGTSTIILMEVVA